VTARGGVAERGGALRGGNCPGSRRIEGVDGVAGAAAGAMVRIESSVVASVREDGGGMTRLSQTEKNR
jgi:hypothetical protein